MIERLRRRRRNAWCSIEMQRDGKYRIRKEREIKEGRKEEERKKGRKEERMKEREKERKKK